MWWVWWKSCDEKRNVTLYLDACVTHMFKECQHLILNFDYLPITRYLFAKEFMAEEFKKNFNNDDHDHKFNVPLNVNYTAQSQITFKLAYTHNNFQFDLGYERWDRSTPNFEKLWHSDYIFKNRAAKLKDDACSSGSVPSCDATSVPLSTEESNVSSYNDEYKPDETAWHKNLPVAANTKFTYDPTQSKQQWANIKTSLEPIPTENDPDDDIYLISVTAHSNKIFFHIGYLWKEHECIVPYLGIGGEIEWCFCKYMGLETTHDEYLHRKTVRKMQHCYLYSQWGIWIKGGFSFN